VLKYGNTEFGLKRIVGITVPSNSNSIRLLERLGMRYEGLFPFSKEKIESKFFAIEFEE
jgi:RimJ/RimL family protein N-acetyltransferase